MKHEGGPVIHRSGIPFRNEPIEAAVVYCSDGRFGAASDEFAAAALGVSRCHRLVVPGGVACLGGHLDARREEEAVVRQLRFLIDVLEVGQVVLIAHEDCAFYSKHLRVSSLRIDSVQQEDMAKAVARVQEMKRSVLVRPYFARIDDDAIVFEEFG